MIIYGIANREDSANRDTLYHHKNFQTEILHTIFTSVVVVVDVATTAATDTRSLTPKV